ncbi:MAG: hypothetical protein AAF203_09925, partial [Pseudomonadota bacterium]
MYYCKQSRRHFLIGSGKAFLALPFLDSLMSAQAFAQATNAQKRFLTLYLPHGNITGEYFYPAYQPNIGMTGSYEHRFHRAPLTLDGGQ